MNEWTIQPARPKQSDQVKPTSWWACPVLHADRSAFQAAAQKERARMSASKLALESEASLRRQAAVGPIRITTEVQR